MNQKFSENALAWTLVGLIAIFVFSWLAGQASHFVDAIEKASQVIR